MGERVRMNLFQATSLPMWRRGSPMMLGPHRGIAFGLLVLLGCGSPAPETPGLGHTTGSAAVPRADLAARTPVGQPPTQIALLGPTTQPAATADAGVTNLSRAGSPAPDSRVQPAAVSTDPSPSNAHADRNQAQYEARQQWLAELRESPDATARLQALALWAAHPDDDLEPLFDALEDDDEQVRTRAEEVWEEQLAREEAETAP